MLVPMKVLLEAAEAGNYAIGAFNVMNMEIVEAALMAEIGRASCRERV